MAPEIIVGNGYSFPVDYWSFGVCIYFIYYGQFPFSDEKNNVMEIYNSIIHNNITFPQVENNVDDLNNFIKLLLCKKPSERLCTLQKIQSTSFYKGFDWKKLSSFQMKAPFCPKENEIENEEASFKNKRNLFLPLIQKYKFEQFFNETNQNKSDVGYNILLNYKEWFEEF